MGKKNKVRLVEINDDQIIYCLEEDIKTIQRNLLDDFKKGIYRNAPDDLKIIDTINEVIAYYGGCRVAFKIPKKHRAKIVLERLSK